ncbi:MAG TPA: AraC family transcriptional regulator [Usitatibacter sp.]|nr:AraC family transcriptional regulator [Usitatibacter sp.]
MDALSEVLRLARFSASVTLDATARAPWCVSVAAGSSILRAHLVVDGTLELRLAGADPVTLKAGDIALLTHGDAHLVGSALDAPAKALSSLVKAPVAGEPMPISLGGDGEPTRWIALSASLERHLSEPYIDALPRVMRVNLGNAKALDSLTDALGLTLSASDAPAVGAGAERASLAELVLVEAMSRYVERLAPGGKGWLAGLADRYVGRALALVHGRPAEAWTVEKLGRQVGLSRSALADRFSEVMGEPIFGFLTRWRLQMAAEILLTTPRSIESIAHDAGYESAGAFSAAFKRVFGKPPSTWRRKRRR